MCGIACVFARRPEDLPDAAALGNMARALAHRGPDDEGILVDGATALIHRRLAVIDPTGARQPMAGADGSVRIVFNGEIYNFREIAAELRRAGRPVGDRSDTEVLLAAYEEWGEACLERLNGMFAFVIHDTRRSRIFAARDRFGEKPLYVVRRDGLVAFASEIKALLAGGIISRALDRFALYQYFTLGYIAAPRSVFLDARRLPPGHALLIEGDSVREWAYWQPPLHRDEVRDAGEASRAAWDLLRDSVRMRLVSDVPLGFFLSGGIDSTAVVALAAETSHSRLETFSVGFEDPRYDERPYARTAAARFGTKHHEFVLRPEGIDVVDELVWNLDEPFADSSALPTYFLSRLTRQHVTVALSGDGGDEVFSGYDVYKGHVLSERVRAIPGPAVSAAITLIEAASSLSGAARARFERLVRNLRDARLEPDARFLTKQHVIFRPAFLAAASRGGTLAPEVDLEMTRVAGLFQKSRSGLAAIASWQLAVSLVDDMLVKVDRMSMAHALEVRAPFLDHRLVEYMSGVPFAVRIPGLRTKYLLKRALEAYFPKSFVWRPKQGFVVPLRHWFRDDLAGYARAQLLRPEARVGNLFRRPTIESVLADHESGRHNWSAGIWAMLVFERWAERFGVETASLLEGGENPGPSTRIA